MQVSINMIMNFYNLPDDLILYTLLYLDNLTLEKIGFRFNPNEFNNNIQKNILWKSWEIEIKSKLSYYVPPKRILNIFNSSPFQNEIKSRTNPLIINILSNYCSICNSFIKPSPNFFNYKVHYLLCNHIPFSKSKLT